MASQTPPPGKNSSIASATTSLNSDHETTLGSSTTSKRARTSTDAHSPRPRKRICLSSASDTTSHSNPEEEPGNNTLTLFAEEEELYERFLAEGPTLSNHGPRTRRAVEDEEKHWIRYTTPKSKTHEGIALTIRAIVFARGEIWIPSISSAVVILHCSRCILKHD